MISIYEQKNTYKLILLFVLLLIIITSILYTDYLASKLSDQEKLKMELIADTYKRLTNSTGSEDLSFMFHIIESNKTVPLILADSTDAILLSKNFDSIKIAKNESYLNGQLAEMKSQRDPIDIQYTQGVHQYMYYGDSVLLKELRYFPFIQFAIILLFIGVAYITFSTARRAEQNRVWAGMAKETAHQLGTPISALSGWVDYMKLQPDETAIAAVLPDVEKDIERLELIAERFSKIGSVPEMIVTNLNEQINKNVDYIKRRASGKVFFEVKSFNDETVNALISPPLFDWVIENLLKNALDAIGGEGSIEISLSKQGSKAIVEIKDSGKGIAAGKFNAIFRPGYSTKKRGWGLGLSLAKRIINEFHKGKIFVKESAIGKGTTFRIVLNS
ncbi:MAG: HAMP domain-containing histidine kinase [Chitinophagales bacterium]|nr:HAMP domain-containing histidine kinase [Chitinophagales bacterium]